MRSILLVGAIGLGSLGACRDGGDGGGTGSSTDGGVGSTTDERAAVLAAFGECAVGTFRAFEERAVALASSAAALASQPTPTARESARQAWRAAMSAWQVAELFQVGPAAVRTLPGGKELRDHIYAWPLFSRCLIEQELVAKGYARPDFAIASLISVRTLSAGEYLLFYDGTDNACSPTVSINSAGTWQALALDELAARKRAYAAVVTTAVLARARELVRAWTPDGENFGRELATAGAGSTVFKTTQAALNAVNEAVFYIEIRGKDQKVGPAVGRKDCMSMTCPDRVESRFAGHAKENLRRNIEGTRKLLFGCGAGGEGLGFDDLLAAKGSLALVDRLRAQVSAVEAALRAVPGEDLREALASDLASMLKLHDALKTLVDTLKTEFVSVLNLEVPKQVEGDND
jgi:predicted lipoprotein